MKLWLAIVSLSACSMDPAPHREPYVVLDSIEDIIKEDPNIILKDMRFISIKYHQEHFQDTNEWIHVNVDSGSKDLFLNKNLPKSWKNKLSRAMALECVNPDIINEICVKSFDTISEVASFENENTEIQYAMRENQDGTFDIWLFKAVH